MSAPTVIHFTQASRKYWILQVVLINSVENTVCKPAKVSLVCFRKSALKERFFFSALLFICANAHPLNIQAFPSNCQLPADQVHSAVIRHIIDGDTVILKNGAKVRLIGIDTPELGYGKKPDQTGAMAAKRYLQATIGENRRISLLYGVEKYDRHGRYLAHIFLADGQNLQARLLRDGLATPFNVPPNLSYVDCYQEASIQARERRVGLWALGEYQARQASSLGGNEHGYHIIEGQISRIGESHSSLWLNMGKHLAIRILRSDLKHFQLEQIINSVGKTVQVRGMIYKKRGQLRMQIRHQADLSVIIP